MLEDVIFIMLVLFLYCGIILCVILGYLVSYDGGNKCLN